MYKSIISAVVVLVVVSSISIFAQINLDAYKELPVSPAVQEVPFFTKIYENAEYIPVETEVTNPNEHVLIVEGIETLTRNQHNTWDSLIVEAEILANTPVTYKKTLPEEVIRFISSLNDAKLKSVLRQMKNNSNNYVAFVLNIKENFGKNATYNDVSSRCGWGI